MEVWYARPDDVIVGKLMAWNEGRSSKHEHDISAMLFFLYMASDPALVPYFDDRYINKKAKTISQDAFDFWRTLKRKAKARIKKLRKS
jgi:hypothetical protein